MNLPIKGLQKTSLIDFPPYISSVVFLGGCNFRCSFCHNPDMVINHHKIKDIRSEEILKDIIKKKKWIDGVCITGGEPLMYPDIAYFISEIKKQGLLVKIDTNGTNPEMLKYLIENKMVDYIAMDIKTSLEKYDQVTGVKVNKEAIKKSIEILKQGGIQYEFRTTAVPGLVEKEDFKKIAEMLKGSTKYCIQQFRNNQGLLNKELQNTEPYSTEELQQFADIVQPYFNEIEVKNV